MLLFNLIVLLMFRCNCLSDYAKLTILQQTSQVFIKPPSQMKGHNNNHQTNYSLIHMMAKNKKQSVNKEPLDSFLNQFLNVYYVISTPLPENDSNKQYFTECSIIKHFQNVTKESDIQPQQPKSTNSKAVIDTFSRTGATIVEDEDSQYLNYLKQYESIIKNSRRRECISPVNHKQEINELISEFLSDKRNQQDKSLKKGDKRGSKSKSVTPIKIQKIDLSNLKTNQTKIKHIEVITAHKIIKQNNQSNNSKQKELVSPRFVNITELNQQQNRAKIKKQIKSTNPKITVIKAEKPKPPPQQQMRIESPLYSGNHTNGQYKETYLKKKIAKLQKIEPLSKKVDRTADTVPLTAINRQAKHQQQKIGRKPIKIQIQIPLQDSDEQQAGEQESPNSHMKTSFMLQHEKEQIIKQISQRVMTLLHKTKQMPSSKP